VPEDTYKRKHPSHSEGAKKEEEVLLKKEIASLSISKK